MIRCLGSKAAILLSFALVGGLLADCAAGDEDGSGGSSAGALPVRVIWPSGTQTVTEAGALSLPPSIRAAAPAGVFSLVATISGPDMADVSAIEDTTPGQSGTFNVDNVPVGTNRTLTLQGFSEAAAAGTVLYEGIQSGITVSAGVNATATVTVSANMEVLPGAPASLSATAGDGTITLAWSEPS